MFTLRLPKRDERGFTLIELLVVIIIISILAAIAIPLFLDQRKLAVDASVKSDVRNTATQVQTWLASNPNTVATDVTAYTAAGGSISQSTGDTVGVSVATDGSYLVCGYAGSAAKQYTTSSAAYVFDSTTGQFGLGSCTGGIVGAGSPSSSSTPSATATSSAPTGTAPTITNASTTLAAAKVSTTYSGDTITASGTPAPTFGVPTAAAGSTSGLPIGLALSSTTGVISGAPASSDPTGTYTFTVTATNGVGTPATKTFTMSMGAFTAISNNADTSTTTGWDATFNGGSTPVSAGSSSQGQYITAGATGTYNAGPGGTGGSDYTTGGLTIGYTFKNVLPGHTYTAFVSGGCYYSNGLYIAVGPSAASPASIYDNYANSGGLNSWGSRTSSAFTVPAGVTSLRVSLASSTSGGSSNPCQVGYVRLTQTN